MYTFQLVLLVFLFLDIYPDVELLDSMIFLFLVFFEKSPYVQTTLFKVAFQDSLISFPLHFSSVYTIRQL